ncbi:MAG: hypothetical protein E7633_09870 [Ruminococcaceae bacterium]|nr:hypothetical protein [Oscillospiraceae bacterium]
MPEFAEVIGVSFRGSGKMYYFAANGFVAKDGDNAIVETARGVEYGKIVLTNKMVSKKELVLPLKNVIRIADENDTAKFEENKKKEEEAFDICQKKIVAHALDMKLIDVEYTFDNSKLLFYFTSDDRVDFRDLVKDLASVFKTRIELRQIGIRDEAKLMGGLGVCGRAFCCHSFLGDFVQVSIKMAKEQNLALNSAKISGACGRLMCCLRYEYDTYQEEARRTPKVDSRVITPDGAGKVTEAKPLLGLVKVALDETPEEQKVYDRKLLRPETPEEFRAAQEKKMLREQKEADIEDVQNSSKANEQVEAKASALEKQLSETKEKSSEKSPEHPKKTSDKGEHHKERQSRSNNSGSNGSNGANKDNKSLPKNQDGVPAKDNANVENAEKNSQGDVTQSKEENAKNHKPHRYNRSRYRKPKNPNKSDG